MPRSIYAEVPHNRQLTKLKRRMGAEGIIFVPFPAQGHITPILHLARVLAARGDVAATVAVPDFVHRRMGLVAGVDLAAIPSGVPDDGGDEPPGFASIVHAMEHHMPGQLEDMLTTRQRGLLSGRGGVACLVVDVLASWALPVAARCGVPAVGFWPVMFASYRVVAAIPELISKGYISKSGMRETLITDCMDMIRIIALRGSLLY